MSYVGLRTETSQQQTLSPRLQQACRLLQMSSQDFAQEIAKVLGSNPFLETDDVSEEPQGALGELAQNYSEAGDSRDAERDTWQFDGFSQNRGSNHDSDISALDLVPMETSLREHLNNQLKLLRLSTRDHVLAMAVIETLDDDGYLRSDPVDLMDQLELDPAVDPQEVSTAIRRVQSLGPAGVAARSVQECLLLQVENLHCVEHREPALLIIKNHLHRLASRDVVGLTRELRLPVATIEAVCDSIRKLDPKPGLQLSSNRTEYVVPDVIVKKVRGKWAVTLNPAVVPKFRLNQNYAELFQEHKTGKCSEMTAHLQEAKWTIKNVEQRFATIVSVAKAIIDRQPQFLEYGPMAMKPLGLREIAQAVGVHESTVSRVTNSKYMATPLGVFELKHFFSRSMPTASGGTCSATAIRGLIKEIIAAEDCKSPLSDAEIARQLSVQGLGVARRTVTKYRQLLKLEPVDKRRVYAARGDSSGVSMSASA
jgi:RNA polymerase sigma-54 factor